MLLMRLLHLLVWYRKMTMFRIIMSSVSADCFVLRRTNKTVLIYQSILAIDKTYNLGK